MGSLGSEHELPVGFEARASFGLGEKVSLQGGALDVLELDDVSCHLFDHVVNACEKVFAPFVVS